MMLAGAAATVALAITPTVAMARDTLSIVGSSTVYPFATVVAERLGRSSGQPTPKIESTGSGGGFKLFCQGVGTATADIVNASRRMKSSEFELCQKNGVKDITEVVIGYDGIVLANSSKAEAIDLTLKDIFLALAKQVPDPNGGDALVANPYRTWKEVNPALPDRKIEVLGPPPTSGTRDAFNELAMEGGCAQLPAIKALKEKDEKQFESVCRGLREDGAFVEAGENDNLIVQKLVANQGAVGIFGYSFLDQNRGKVQGAHINGVAPTFDTISSAEYPVSRSLYFYVKNAHIGVVPGIRGYVKEFTSERAWGGEGYLADKGMIPLPDDQRAEIGKQAQSLTPMTGKEL